MVLFVIALPWHITRMQGILHFPAFWCFQYLVNNWKVHTGLVQLNVRSLVALTRRDENTVLSAIARLPLLPGSSYWKSHYLPGTRLVKKRSFVLKNAFSSPKPPSRAFSLISFTLLERCLGLFIPVESGNFYRTFSWQVPSGGLDEYEVIHVHAKVGNLNIDSNSCWPVHRPVSGKNYLFSSSGPRKVVCYWSGWAINFENLTTSYLLPCELKSALKKASIF